MSDTEEQVKVGETTETKDDELNPENVHSANSWESVDMGDDDRKKKFLRLMGASKKEHSGRFVIGDKDSGSKHGRAKDDTDKLNKDLEDQYRRSNELKVNRFSHKGLGFSDERRIETDTDKAQGDVTVQSESNNEETSDEKKLSDKKISSDNDRKRESAEPTPDASSPPKKPKMMMAFVKSSD